MTGKGHRSTGLGAGFFAAACMHVLGFDYVAEFVAAFAAALSVNLPDQLEFPRYKNGQRRGTRIPHRTITHWPYLWLALMYIGWQYVDPLPAALLIGLSIGALMHILTDAPNPMGIPWVLPHRPVSLTGGLWLSGEFEKTIATFANTGGILTWLYVHQFLNWIPPFIAGLSRH